MFAVFFKAVGNRLCGCREGNDDSFFLNKFEGLGVCDKPSAAVYQCGRVGGELLDKRMLKVSEIRLSVLFKKVA